MLKLSSNIEERNLSERVKKLDFFRKQGLIIKELPGINDGYFTRSQLEVVKK
ncbi:MAG: hypothetical protein AB1765_11935 [Candidatus Hydrogenedentota bacterium]